MKPTQEQVTEWSTEAGLYASRQTDDKFDWKIIYAQQFATLAYEAGRKDENEACAKVCEDRVLCYLKDGERWMKGENGKPDFRLKDVAPHLEAAWEQEQLLQNKSVVLSITESERCAIAIRARREQ